MIRKFIRAFIFTGFLFFCFGTSNSLAVSDCSDVAYAKANESLCKNELSQIEAQLQELLKKQEEQKKHTGTLKSDVDYLNAQINALKTKIKARGLAIAQLKNSIIKKVATIETLSQKIEKEHESLAQLLRNTNEFDNENILHLILSDKSISDFYSDLESYTSIKNAIKASVEEITGIKKDTEAEKKDLEKKQDAEVDAKAELENAQKKVTQSEVEKKELLAISKKKESDYQKLAAEKRARAEKIRTALFSLAGTSQKIEFGTALEYANEAKQKMGIDPAFLLAVITQESNLGANVGLCLLTDTNTGNGKGANTGSAQIRVMHPTRDIPVFINLTEKLGLSYLSTRVSCWQPAYTKAGAPSGWGGAMGPAQFIPSTWKIFENRLKSMLGHEANPWFPRDAFMASAMYLTDLGAVGNSYSAQIKAACRYYGTGGTTCSYGRSVMGIKAKVQDNIDLLSD